MTAWAPNWAQSSLLDLLDTSFDGAWGNDEGSNGRLISVLRSTDMRGGKLDFSNVALRYVATSVVEKKKLRNGDILINKSSGSAHLVGASVIFFANAGEDFLCSNFTRCLRPDVSIVDPEFLHYALLSRQFRSQVFGAQRTTSGLRNLKIDEFQSSLIGYPEDLSEQRLIVARIKECMVRVEEIETNATTVDRELDALFPALLNERFNAIRDAHCTRQLEDVADIRGGSSLPEGTAIDEGFASALLVKVGDMNTNGNERIINAAREFYPLAQSGRGTIQAGAVIFPKRGGAIATNKKRLLGRPALLDPNLMAVVAKPEVLRPDYLYYWCLTLDLSKLSNGGVIPQLNRKDLAPLELPVPDMAEQGQIVEELQQAEHHCSQLKIEFESAQADRARLREAILRKAFAGEL